MNPADLPLRDIHLPAPPSWWPPAPGWWALLAALALTALALAWWLQRRRCTRGRRAALARLRELAASYAADGDAQALAAEISTLLRRLALSLRPRAEVAGLWGRNWLELLDALSPRAPFDASTRRALTEAPYRSSTACDGQALIAACERWLRALPARSGTAATPRRTPSSGMAEAPR